MDDPAEAPNLPVPAAEEQYAESDTDGITDADAPEEDPPVQKSFPLEGIISTASSLAQKSSATVKSAGRFCTRNKGKLKILTAGVLLNAGLPLEYNGHPLRLPILDVPAGIFSSIADQAGLLSRQKGDWNRYVLLEDAVENLQAHGFETENQDILGMLCHHTASITTIGRFTGWNPFVSMQTPSLDVSQEGEFAIPSAAKDNSFSVILPTGHISDRRDATYSPAAFEQIPDTLVKCIVFQEDRTFFSSFNRGIDYPAMGRSLLKTLTGEAQGASTITMQAVREITHGRENMSPSGNLFQKTWRKIHEFAGAVNLSTPPYELLVQNGYDLLSAQREQKERILAFYLNNTYFGNGNHGWKESSKDYFGTASIGLPEAAFLSSLANKPLNPRLERGHEFHWSRAQNLLRKMHEAGAITTEEYSKALHDTPQVVREDPRPGKTQFESAVDTALLEIQNATGVDIYDLRRMQQIGFEANITIDPLEHNNLYRAAQKMFRTTEFTADDPEFGGVVVRDDGSIAAVLAGRSYDTLGHLNFAHTSQEAGSSLKWLLHAQLLDILLDPYDSRGSTSFDLDLMNATTDPLQRYGYDENKIKDEFPQFSNMDGQYRPVTLDVALQRSKNLTHVKLLSEIGVHAHLDFLTETGLHPNLGEADLTLALGNAGYTVKDMAGATTLLSPSSLGARYDPHIVLSVELGGIRLEREKRETPIIDDYAAKRIAESLMEATRATSPAALTSGWDVGTKSGTHENRIAAEVGYAVRSDGLWRGFAFRVSSRRNKNLSDNLYAGKVLGPVIHTYLASFSESSLTGRPGQEHDDPEAQGLQKPTHRREQINHAHEETGLQTRQDTLAAQDPEEQTYTMEDLPRMEREEVLRQESNRRSKWQDSWALQWEGLLEESLTERLLAIKSYDRFPPGTLGITQGESWPNGYRERLEELGAIEKKLVHAGTPGTSLEDVLFHLNMVERSRTTLKEYIEHFDAYESPKNESGNYGLIEEVYPHIIESIRRDLKDNLAELEASDGMLASVAQDVAHLANLHPYGPRGPVSSFEWQVREVREKWQRGNECGMFATRRLRQAYEEAKEHIDLEGGTRHEMSSFREARAQVQSMCNTRLD